MSEALAKARAVAAKRKTRVEKLRKEIAARKAGRGGRALARAEAALPEAEADAKSAADRVASLEKSLAAIRAAPPSAIKKTWDKERADEPKKLVKRIKALRRRVTVDLRDDPASTARAHFGMTVKERERPMPVVEAETWPSGPIIPYVPPKIDLSISRPGLDASDYRIISRTADIEAYVRPERWTAFYVGSRLGEAHATLRRLPMKTRPAEFGSAMPEYIHEGVELAYQAGAGTLFQNRGRVRPIRGTGAGDVARMNEALSWPLEFLSKHEAHAFAVNEWAFWRDLDQDEAARLFGLLTQQALEFIAAKLNVKGRPVT